MVKQALTTTMGLWLGASVALAQDAAVAKVLSANYGASRSAEIELQVLKGTLYTNSSVEVFEASAGKMQGTLKLQSGVDMARSGDRLKATIVTRGPFPLSGALVAEEGKFGSHAAALKAAGGQHRPRPRQPLRLRQPRLRPRWQPARTRLPSCRKRSVSTSRRVSPGLTCRSVAAGC